MLECAGSFFAQSAQNLIVDVGQFHQGYVRCKSEQTFDSENQQVGNRTENAGNAKIDVIPYLYGLALEEQTVNEVQAEMGGIGGDDYKHHSGEQVAALCQLPQAIAGGKSGKGLDHKEFKRVGQCYGAGEKGNHVRYKSRARVQEDAHEDGQNAIGNHQHVHQLVLYKRIGDQREYEVQAGNEHHCAQPFQIVVAELLEVEQQEQCHDGGIKYAPAQS